MQTETFQTKYKEGFYEDLFQHLFDELRLLNLRLLKYLRKKQQAGKAEECPANGFFITDEEVASILTSLPQMDASDSIIQEIESLNLMIDEAAAEISDKRLSGKYPFGFFPLMKLIKFFGLTQFESDLIIMALAPEIDKRYERVYAYFNDDISKKSPSIETALNVLCGSREDGLSALRFFSANAPLLYFDLIRLTNANDETTFSNRRFGLDERIMRFISGDNNFPGTLSEITTLYYPNEEFHFCRLSQSRNDKIVRIITERKTALRQVFWLYGKAVEEKRATVFEVCKDLKLPVLTADLEDIFFEPDHRSFLKSLFREALLQSAVVFLKGGDRLYQDDEKSDAFRRTILRIINDISWITFISAENLWMPGGGDGVYQWYPFEVKFPGYHERKLIWKDFLINEVSDEDIDALSGRFNFTGAQIKSVVNHARQAMNGNMLTIKDIYSACAIHSNHRLSAYSKRLSSCYKWEDIVLPEDKLNQLRDILNYIKYKHIVYFRWGFDKKSTLGLGVNILFSGSSGTGKTMAASIIADELGLEIYRIDLSAIVSKYIGETEKNLNRIFRESNSGNVILFFDEADALFGKRSEVKDSHDRYANIEISHLLQKMEEHEGIVILATNLSKNIDDAFSRRMHFTVEFPFPGKDEREAIWRKMFPANAPVSKDIDYGFLAGRFKIAGGNIRNIAVASAFYAAEASSEIQMRHIILAVKREFQKMGKLCLKGDFGEFYKLLEEETEI